MYLLNMACLLFCVSVKYGLSAVSVKSGLSAVLCTSVWLSTGSTLAFLLFHLIYMIHVHKEFSGVSGSAEKSCE